MRRNSHPRPVCAAFYRVVGCSGPGKCATGPVRRLQLYRVYRSTPTYLDKTADSGKKVAFYAECD